MSSLVIEILFLRENTFSDNQDFQYSTQKCPLLPQTLPSNVVFIYSLNQSLSTLENLSIKKVRQHGYSLEVFYCVMWDVAMDTPSHLQCRIEVRKFLTEVKSRWKKRMQNILWYLHFSLPWVLCWCFNVKFDWSIVYALIFKRSPVRQTDKKTKTRHFVCRHVLPCMTNVSCLEH